MKTEKNNQIKEDRFIEQGTRLGKCLKYAGKKQKELAEILFVSPTLISDIICGKKGIPAAHIDQIAEYLNVKREYLQLKSEYMTEEQRISDICSERSKTTELCFELLDSLGYRILDTEQQADGSYSSMHRPYCQITVNKKIDDFSRDDTDTEILEKARAAVPVRVYRIITPSGKHIQATQAQLTGIAKSILSFASFQIENIDLYSL